MISSATAVAQRTCDVTRVNSAAADLAGKLRAAALFNGRLHFALLNGVKNSGRDTGVLTQQVDPIASTIAGVPLAPQLQASGNGTSMVLCSGSARKRT